MNFSFKETSLYIIIGLSLYNWNAKRGYLLCNLHSDLRSKNMKIVGDLIIYTESWGGYIRK